MALLRIILFPLRLLLWPFRAMRRAGPVRKSAGSAVAGVVRDREGEFKAAPARAYTFFFAEIGRPRLPLVAASEFDTAVARRLAKEADAFYSKPFELFPSGSLFYEEVERQELRAALAGGEDADFVAWAAAVRKTLNGNTRRLFLYYTPLVLLISALAAFVLVLRMETQVEVPVLGTVPRGAVAWPGAMGTGLIVLMLLYHWPYKFAQQRNLLGLDNTITSRFSQLNQNFQVAKRRALNVEKDKRMNQVDELVEEAGVWTLAYQWLALRLYLSERLVRNQMYQVNRNAKLYAAGGLALCLAIVLCAEFLLPVLMPARVGLLTETLWSLGAGISFAILAYAVGMAGAAGEARRVLSDNEWFRFSRIELDRAIAEHVGEDKLQIITFRDRNRFE